VLKNIVYVSFFLSLYTRHMEYLFYINVCSHRISRHKLIFHSEIFDTFKMFVSVARAYASMCKVKFPSKLVLLQFHEKR
jgi:hypothetical protein